MKVHLRKREFLGIYLEPDDIKTFRHEKLQLAESIKAKRQIELINEEYSYSKRFFSAFLIESIDILS